MLRIGRIEYANCTPIFRMLQDNVPCDSYRFIGGVPAQLNSMLATGGIDICPSSSIEYALHPDRYVILPQLSISSIGAVGSVLLFSRVPIEELDGRNVQLSSESATSVNLLKILLSKRFNSNSTFSLQTSSFEVALQEAPALLLIGDAALKASFLRPDLLIYDLGQLWYDWTALPFVFALWLCRLPVAMERSVEVAKLAGRLEASKLQARETLQLIAESSPEIAWIEADRLVAYWRENISWDLDERHLKGLVLFYHNCVELGLLEIEPELQFFTGSLQKDLSRG